MECESEERGTRGVRGGRMVWEEQGKVGTSKY